MEVHDQPNRKRYVKQFALQGSRRRNHQHIRAFRSLGAQSLPSPCRSGARDLRKTAKRKVVSEDVHFVGCRTAEQTPPRSRGILLIQVENSAPCRMAVMIAALFQVQECVVFFD